MKNKALKLSFALISALLILSFSESYEITKQVNVLTHTGALGRICINELYRPIR